MFFVGKRFRFFKSKYYFVLKKKTVVVENGDKKFESVYSTKVRAGKRRTYFFDVRKTKGEDFYITLTESTRKFDGNGYERHKIFLYKEDFNRFLKAMEETINHVKTELMPDYDYEEFEKRQAEWEAKKAAEAAAGITYNPDAPKTESAEATPEAPKESTESTEDDMSW